MLILSFFLFLSLCLNLFFLWEKYNRSRVVKVLDGDTFVLNSGQRVRLLAVNAPEKGACLGQEATDLLTKLVLNKRVRLEETTHDDYGRILAVTFVDSPFSSPVILSERSESKDLSRMRDISVNQQLAQAGLVSHTSSAGKYSEPIEEAIRKAKAEHLAIYSDKCQSPNPPNPQCNIKGNIDQSSGTKFYHLSSCLHYGEIVINTALGEKWFCSEAQAQKSGFQKASGCR